MTTSLNDASPWFLYIIRCRDNSLYIGITTDVARRFQEHSDQGPKSAKYLRGRTPLALVYQTELPDRAIASKYENLLKKRSKREKENLIAGNILWEDLFEVKSKE